MGEWTEAAFDALDRLQMRARSVLIALVVDFKTKMRGDSKLGCRSREGAMSPVGGLAPGSPVVTTNNWTVTWPDHPFTVRLAVTA